MSTGALRKPLVIGLTGPIGSGVSTVAGVLEQRLGFQRIRLSKIIAAEWERTTGMTLPAPPDRRVVLQDYGNQRRADAGRDYWIRQALAADALKDKERVVFEGLRNLGEVESLREQYRWFFLFALDAPGKDRWNRVREHYQGNEAAFERDDKRDRSEDETSGQQVGKCVSDADYLMKNHVPHDYSEVRADKFALRLEREVGVMVGSKLRPPDPWEVHMATAYAQSLGSQCVKRNVGAVVVNPDGLGLSMGYNENPVSMRPCKYEYGGCFKDQDMNARLEKMAGARCPKCGHPQSRMVAPWVCEKPGCKENLKDKFFPSRNLERCTALHAEERAIRGLPGGKAPGATMYVTTCPCFQCARYIVEAGIVKVVYVEAYPVMESIDFMIRNKVEVESFEGFKSRAYTRLFRGAE